MNSLISKKILKIFYKYIYKATHTKSFNHNRRYWPYYKVYRNSNECIEKVYYNNKLIADNTIPINHTNQTCIIVATGPSVKNINNFFFQKKEYDYIGLNGAINLKNCSFQYYVIIDHDFINNKFNLVLEILSKNNCILFITPRCLELILSKTNFEKIICSFRIIDIITENKLERFMGPKKIVKDNQKFAYLENNIGFSLDIFNATYDYYTVAYVALQVAYYLNYKNILLVGLDMNNFNLPRFYETAENKEPTHLNNDLEAINEAFKVAANFFKQKNINIYNLSSNSSIESFPKISFQKFI